MVLNEHIFADIYDLVALYSNQELVARNHFPHLGLRRETRDDKITS